MKQGRLQWLLIAMCVLALLRVFVPSSKPVSPALAEAIVRQPTMTLAGSSTPFSAMPPLASTFALAASRERNFREEPDVPGNAFSVRPPPLPPYMPPAPPVAKAKALPLPVTSPVAAVFTAPVPQPAAPSAAAPLLLPFQVIGTWDDGKEPGVFLSGPHGTLLARIGATLLAEYTVMAITAQQVSFVHISSKREVSLPVPMPPNTPRTYQ